MEKASYDFFHRLIACGIILCLFAGLKYSGLLEAQRKTLKSVISENIGFAPGKLPSPTSGTVTAVYGGDHKGIDIANAEGTPIKTVAEGTVLESAENDSYGKYIKIEHKDSISLYAHCSELLVNEGDKVTQNQEIARMGSTGDSTGSHLHFEIIKDNKNIDPMAKVDIE